MSVYPLLSEGIALEGPVARASGESPRAVTLGARLVPYLIVAIVLLSLGDLAMTLVMVTQLGMVEVNPLARAVMHMGSPAMIAVWKLATLALASLILFRARHRLIGQIGAWVGFLLLSGLTVYWALFVDQLGAFACATEWSGSVMDDRWVQIVSAS